MSWEEATLGSGHITKPGRVQEAFAQWSQAHDVTPGDACARLKAELNDPCGSHKGLTDSSAADSVFFLQVFFQGGKVKTVNAFDAVSYCMPLL